jgi:hypothetical protein
MTINAIAAKKESRNPTSWKIKYIETDEESQTINEIKNRYITR